MTLCHSRHGYEEAVWDQKVATFLRLHENAFRDLGGVVRVVRHDNLKAVVRACLYDPDVNPVYEAFSKHWGFTALPARPRNPQENGKQERSGGYVKGNALAGRRFDSLGEQNEFLRHWNRTVARVRIHGTTRRQVFTHYEETDKKALQPLVAEPFAIFTRGTRSVHPDGYIEVDGAFYPVPLHLIGTKVEARWDARLIRVFAGETAVGVHARVRAGEFARRPGERAEPTSSQRAYGSKLIATVPASALRFSNGPGPVRRSRRSRASTDPGRALPRTQAPQGGRAARRGDGQDASSLPLQRSPPPDRAGRLGTRAAESSTSTKAFGP